MEEVPERESPRQGWKDRLLRKARAAELANGCHESFLATVRAGEPDRRKSWDGGDALFSRRVAGVEPQVQARAWH